MEPICLCEPDQTLGVMRVAAHGARCSGPNTCLAQGELGLVLLNSSPGLHRPSKHI